jgi:hypothetical protein
MIDDQPTEESVKAILANLRLCPVCGGKVLVHQRAAEHDWFDATIDEMRECWVSFPSSFCDEMGQLSGTTPLTILNKGGSNLFPALPSTPGN